jgi:hypothetical protein
MSLTDFDKEHIEDILTNNPNGRWDWFSCKLLRLISIMDSENRTQMHKAFPDHVEAYENYFAGRRYKNGRWDEKYKDNNTEGLPFVTLYKYKGDPNA